MDRSGRLPGRRWTAAEDRSRIARMSGLPFLVPFGAGFSDPEREQTRGKNLRRRSLDTPAGLCPMRVTEHRPMAVVLGARVIEVVRSLAMADIPVGMVTPTGDPARWSRYAHNVMTWDWMQPAERHDEALADRLVEFARRQPAPPVLMYCSDQSMVFVSQHRERLAEGFRFIVPDAGLVEAMEDKAQFVALAAAQSLPVPPTVVLDQCLPDPPGRAARPRAAPHHQADGPRQHVGDGGRQLHQGAADRDQGGAAGVLAAAARAEQAGRRPAEHPRARDRRGQPPRLRRREGRGRGRVHRSQDPDDPRRVRPHQLPHDHRRPGGRPARPARSAPPSTCGASPSSTSSTDRTGASTCSRSTRGSRSGHTRARGPG